MFLASARAATAVVAATEPVFTSRSTLMQTKDVRKRRNYKFAWFKDNQILLRKVEGGILISIRSFNDLTSI